MNIICMGGRTGGAKSHRPRRPVAGLDQELGEHTGPRHSRRDFFNGASQCDGGLIWRWVLFVHLGFLKLLTSVRCQTDAAGLPSSN